MSLLDETKRTYQRFQVYVDALRAVFSQYGVDKPSLSNYMKLYRLLLNDHWMRDKVVSILKDAAVLEGGKLSLSTIGILFGLAIGGVGIAGMGTAIGIPAFLVTALGGLLGGFLGQEVDAQRFHMHSGLEINPALSLPSPAAKQEPATAEAEDLNSESIRDFAVMLELSALRGQMELMRSELEKSFTQLDASCEASARKIRRMEQVIETEQFESATDRSQVLSSLTVLSAEVSKSNSSVSELSEEVRDMAQASKRLTNLSFALHSALFLVVLLFISKLLLR